MLQSQITSVQSKLLCGPDTVEKWSEQRIWDAMLHNIRIVVSTYQILFDATKHGFVGIESLALIVFDEGWLAQHAFVKSNLTDRLTTLYSD